MGFGSGALATNSVINSIAPLAAPSSAQDQYVVSSLQAPSAAFSNNNATVPSLASSHGLQQQRQLQLPLMQQQLGQQQRQAIANTGARNAEEEFVQEYLKAQWNRQFE